VQIKSKGNDINTLTLKMFSHSAPVPSTSFPRIPWRAQARESRGVAHETIKLSYFLPAPGFRVKPGMTIARAYSMAKEECLFVYVIHYKKGLAL
jgi:hypothetical protein